MTGSQRYCFPRVVRSRLASRSKVSSSSRLVPVTTRHVQVEHTKFRWLFRSFTTSSVMTNNWSSSFANSWLMSRQPTIDVIYAVGFAIFNLVGEKSTASIGKLARLDQYTAPRITQSRGFLWYHWWMDAIIIIPLIWTLTTKILNCCIGLDLIHQCFYFHHFPHLSKQNSFTLNQCDFFLE